MNRIQDLSRPRWIVAVMVVALLAAAPAAHAATGFSIGDTLPSVTAHDENGDARDLRDGLEGGTSFTLIDVCALSGACRATS